MKLSNLNQVVGNLNVLSMIKHALANGSMPTVCLFDGKYGTGKSTCARLVGTELVDGDLSRLVSVNIPYAKDQRQLSTLVKQEFGYDLSRPKVLVLEEFHVLNRDEASIFLDAITNKSDLLYVIITTTKTTALLDELVSRCTVFTFKNLSLEETRLLVYRECGDTFMFDEHVLSQIYKKTKGTPRDVIKIVSFLSDVKATPEQIVDFLGVVPIDEFVVAFENASDFDTYITCVEHMLSTYAVDDVLNALKEFIIELTYTAHGSPHRITTERYEMLCKVCTLNADVLFKIRKTLLTLPVDENSILMYLINIRHAVLIADKSTSSVSMQRQNAADGITAFNLRR